MCGNPRDSKNFFKAVSPYISDKRISNGSRIILREKETVVTEPDRIADIFNQYYRSLSDYESISDSLHDLCLEEVLHKHSSHKSIILIKHPHEPLINHFEFKLITDEIMMKYLKKTSSKITRI